jgi:hypothetical protein
MQSSPLGNGIYKFQGVPVSPTGTVDAVIWHSNVKLDSGHFISYGTSTKVSAEDIERNAAFQKVALAAQLGIPLGSVPVAAYVPERTPNGTASLSHVVQSNAHMKAGNIFANYMHASIDTSNPNTFSYHRGPPFEGDVLFMRLDHGPLDERQMSALEQFCCSMKGFLTYRDTVGGKPDRIAYAKEILAPYPPKAFAEFFANHRLTCIARGLKEWDGTECPVLALCGGCLKDASEVKLQVCGKCKRRMYCGADCQKGDWARHKKVCQKAKE